MISVIGANMNYKELKEVGLKRPIAAGARWTGIPHHVLVRKIMKEARRRGCDVLDSQFAVARGGADLAGAIALRVPDVPPPMGLQLSLGLITSNARRRATRLYSGATILVCHNGMATGSQILNIKHDDYVDVDIELKKAMDKYIAQVETISAMVAAMRDCKVKPSEASHMFLQAGAKGIIGWSKVGAAAAIYKKTPSVYINDWGKNTAWAVLNALTYEIKNLPAHTQMDATNQARELVLSYTLAG